MADESDELVCSVLLDKKYDFVVVVSKSRTILELRAEIDDVVREVYPEFRGGQVSRVENQRGSILPDRYKVGVVLQNERRIICYSSAKKCSEECLKETRVLFLTALCTIDATGGKEKENAKNLSQEEQTSETVRNKPSVTNNTAKHSLPEAKRTLRDTVCGSSEDMLSASKYKSLFTMPEHCRPKRKGAIESSASKVAEWLSSHDVSSNVDAQDTQSDEGTMEVESECEDQPKPVKGKRLPVVEKRVKTVRSINRRGNSDDDDDDDDDADDVYYDAEDDAGSYRENEDSYNSDDSMVESLNNKKRATAKKTTCYSQNSVSAKRDACVSMSTSESKRRAVDSTSKKNEALSATSRGTQSNLFPSASDRENRSANNSDFPSSAGNLLKCRIKVEKLPICIKHGRNLKVVQQKTRHENNKRLQHGDVTSNRGNEDKGEHRQEKESDSKVPQKEVHSPTIKHQRIQKTKNTRRKDYYTDIDGGMESGGELLNDKRRKLVNSLSGTVKKHLGSKDEISNKFPRRATIQRRSYVETSAQGSSRDEHDDHGGVLTENGDNSNGVSRGLRQSSQPLREDATTKNDNDGDNDNDDDESDELTPHKHKNRLTVAEVYDDEEFDVQKGAGCKEKREISWKGKEIQTRGTNSTEESRTQNIDKQMEKQVSVEKDMGSPPRQCRSPKNDLLSKTSLSASKSKGAVESSKQKTDDTFERGTVDNPGERQLCRAMNETSRLGTVPMKDKSPAESPVDIEPSKGKHSGVGADEASGIVVQESRESVIDSNVESAGNTNDHASEDDTSHVSQTDEETEGENKESTPMYLTLIKKGKQVAWLKESSKEAVSEQTGDEYEDFMKRLEISVCNITSDEHKRSKTENSAPLSSETDKKSESNEEKGEEDVESRKNSERKSTEKKKRSEGKKRRLEGNDDAFERNVNQECVSDETIMRNKTMEENVELEFSSEDCNKKRSEVKRRKVEESEGELLENVNQEGGADRRGISEIEDDDDRRVISEKTMEGNVELKSTSQSPIKKRRSEQKQRKMQKNEDTLVEDVGQESVGDRRVISEKTMEGNVELKSTSQSPIKKRSEQKQRKLQKNVDTLVEDVGQESVGDRRVISEKTMEGNVELKSTSQSPIKKRSEQKQRKLQKNEDTLVEDVGQESVGDRRVISEKTMEGNVELKSTSQSPIKKRSEQKQRKLQKNVDTLVEDVGQESVGDRRVISEKTMEGNVELKSTSQSPIKKRSEQKRRKLQKNEDTLVEDVGQESVGDRRVISDKTMEGNVELKSTSQSPIKKRSEQKQRKLQKNEDTLVEDVGQESVGDRRVISEKTMEGNVELKSTSQSPIKKRSEQKQRKLQKNEDTLVEDVGQESVGDRRVISEKTMKGIVALEVTPQSPIKKRSEQKQRKLQKNEDTLVENVGQESASDTAITLKKRLGSNVELECATEDPVDNNTNIKIALKRKAAIGDYQCNLLKESDRLASVGMETPKKKARDDGYREDKRNDNDEKTLNEETVEGAVNITDGLQERNQNKMLKKNKKKKKTKEKGKKKSVLRGTERTPESTLTSPILKKVELSQSKDQQNERVEREFASSAKNKHQISNGKANKDSNCGLLQIEQESQAFLDEERLRKSNDRQTSNPLEKVNSTSDQLQKEMYIQQSKKKKKEKRKTGELNRMESATEIPSPPTLGTVTSDSLDDSGYSEYGNNKSKQQEQCRPEQVESVQQPRTSKESNAATNGLQTSKPDANYSQQKTNSKKKSKTSLSLLDLALDDDAAEQGASNKASNCKTVRSEGRPAHQMARHFRQTPKGFLHSANIRKTASRSTIIIRRKPRINPKANPEVMAKGKDLATSGVSLEQLLDDESLWTT